MSNETACIIISSALVVVIVQCLSCLDLTCSYQQHACLAPDVETLRNHVLLPHLALLPLIVDSRQVLRYVALLLRDYHQRARCVIRLQERHYRVAAVVDLSGENVHRARVLADQGPRGDGLHGLHEEALLVVVLNLERPVVAELGEGLEVVEDLHLVHGIVLDEGFERGVVAFLRCVLVDEVVNELEVLAVERDVQGLDALAHELKGAGPRELVGLTWLTLRRLVVPVEV